MDKHLRTELIKNKVLKKTMEFLLLFFYKAFFEFIFLKKYMSVYGYMYNSYIYKIDISKWCISAIIFVVFALLLFSIDRDSNEENNIYLFLYRFIYVICIIPMLSVYASFDGIAIENIIYPTLFLLILMITFKNISKKETKQLFKMPRILHINIVLLLICAIVAVLIWVYCGKPFFLNISAALDRRLELRVSKMPTILNYTFILLGSTVFPYLFAKYIDEKKYFYSLISFLCGILMFFINGMKTWLFLYLFFFGIIIIFKFGKAKSHTTCILIELMMAAVVIISVLLLDVFHISTVLSQVARITAVPNDLGFTFVAFFKDPQHPYLYLSESVLRLFFESPYPNGSDFYVTNGLNITVSSARANNGLWGDAFKNFGLVGIVLYPIFIAKIFSIIESNSRHMKPSLRLFVLFMALWGSINTSFFTWLLTGGVLVIILLEKIDRSNREYIVRSSSIDERINIK